MKNKWITKVLCFALAAVVAVTSVPVMTANAEESQKAVSVSEQASVAKDLVQAKAATVVTGVKQTDCYYNGTTAGVKLSWNALSGAERYVVVIEDAQGKYVEDNGYATSALTDTVYGLAPGKTYYAIVGAVKYDTETYRYDILVGESAKVEVVTPPALDYGKKTKVTKMTKDGATISWDAVPGATSYEVEYYGYDANYNKLPMQKATTKTNSITLKLKKNVQYNVAVTPVRASKTFKASYNYYTNADKIQALPAVDKIEIRHWNGLKQFDFRVDDLFWSGDETEYEIYDYAGKKKLATIKEKSSYTADWKTKKYAGKNNSTFKVRARASKTVDGEKFTSGWSDWQYFGTRMEVKGKAASKKIKLSWKKRQGATRYYVEGSTDNKKYKKIATTKSKSYTVKKVNGKKLKKGKTYYVNVVAQKKVNGKWVNISDNSYCYRVSCR